MNKMNSWLDPAPYMTLTAPGSSCSATSTVVAADKEKEEDNETDSYLPPPPNIPFTVDHLHTTLHAMGPLIAEFPIPTPMLMGIGSLCTVINSDLCDCLSLHRYPLPKKGNNLSSLSNTLLICEESVKLELTSGQGAWKLRVHKMKVNKGLPFLIILGML
jgi:hypothetical protein